jgi:peptide/nickel transport system permease protein
MQLAVVSWLFATLLGVPLGILSAVHRGSFWDYVGRGLAITGQALPQFWIGIMGILLFAVYLGWLPTATKGNPGDSLFTQARYFVMPVIVLGWSAAAGYVRITRSAMLEILDSEFIKLARAKGVSSWKVTWKHAFRNALIPPITISGLLLANFLNGAVVVEAVFAWPGLGSLAAQSVFNNDFPLLTGIVLVFAFIFVTASFLSDIAYALADPRIRY